MSTITLERPTAPPQPGSRPGTDYALVARAIRAISEHHAEQPALDELAVMLDTAPARLTRCFRDWAGLTPKQFLGAVTMNRARSLLADGMPLLDASLELGLSGPSRLHDLFVEHEAMSPGEWRRGGSGLLMRWGRHESPFGTAVVMATERGLAGLAFDDDETGRDGYADLARRWPGATFERDDAGTAALASRAFARAPDPGTPLRVVLIGTDFQVRVWEALLAVPRGRATTYGALARAIGRPKASRAVGAAVGANPVSFVVPCHRAVGSTGKLTGYHWGLTRKRAMLGWEAA